MSKDNSLYIKPIAKIKNGYKEKFGIPRQSGLASEVISKIVFEKEYRNPDAIRGIEAYSHLWLIWNFSETRLDKWKPTVRPPKLGGNIRMGVFATRSPFRPNPLGLSCVKLMHVDYECSVSPVIYVSGADLLDNTPIFDIKPYIPYSDMVSGAKDGFSVAEKTMKVNIPENLSKKIKECDKDAIISILSCDPRPGYQNDPDRVYGISYAEYNIKFKVCDNIVFVIDVE